CGFSDRASDPRTPTSPKSVSQWSSHILHCATMGASKSSTRAWMHWCTVKGKRQRETVMSTLDEREQQTMSKRCTRCGEVRPLEEFSPHKGMRDGRDPR